jgi:hypothetical protein
VIEFVITTIAIGLFLSIPVVFIQKYLINEGYVRESIWDMVVGMILVVFIKRIWLQDASWWFFAPFAVIACILSMNRGDLWYTMNNGRWWCNTGSKG